MQISKVSSAGSLVRLRAKATARRVRLRARATPKGIREQAARQACGASLKTVKRTTQPLKPLLTAMLFSNAIWDLSPLIMPLPK